MKNNRDLTVSLTVMALWGLLFPVVKLGYRVFQIHTVGDTLTYAGLRFLVCGALLLVLVAVKMPGALRDLRSTWGLVLLVGLFGIVLHYGLSYIGLHTTDGSKTAILKQMGAVFYVCCAGFFFPEEKLTAFKLGGLALGILGILAINAQMTGFQIRVGDILVLGASFSTVFSNVISKKAVDKVEPIVLCAVSQLFGGGVLLAIGLLVGGEMERMAPSTPEQAAVFGLMIVASVVSYSLWYMAVRKQALSRLFLVKFSEPLFAAVFSWLLLGEDILRINYVLGFILISGGIVLSSRKSGPENHAAAHGDRNISHG